MDNFNHLCLKYRYLGMPFFCDIPFHARFYLSLLFRLHSVERRMKCASRVIIIFLDLNNPFLSVIASHCVLWIPFARNCAKEMLK